MNLYKLTCARETDLGGSGGEILIGDDEKKIGGGSGDEVGYDFVSDRSDRWRTRDIDLSLKKDVKASMREEDEKGMCMSK